jgi:MFS family permease
VWQLGLLTSVLASLGFGLADSVPLFLLMRGLQGLGFALSTIAGLGLLIECSPDLTADIARQEVLVGLSMVAAPAVGGLLYTYAGFAAIFNILAAGFMLLVLGLTAGRKLGYLGGREGGREGEEEEDAWWRVSSWPGSVSTWCCCAAAAEEEGRRSGGEEGSEEEAATALLIPQETTEVIKTQGLASPTSPSPPPLTLLGMLLLPGVLAAALLVMVTFHSISFLELAFAGHAEAALGLAPLGTGLLFSCVDIAYATCAYLMARARKGGKGGREGGREEEKEEEDRLSAVRRREGGHEEEGQRTLSRSSSTSSSSSSSSTSSSRFGLSFLNLRALALTGLACQALAMCFLGPLPLFSLPLPSFLPPSLLAWVSVAIGCLMVGMGEALALVPAVDLMRAGLPPSLPLAMSDGSNSGEGATGHLAAVMSAATSLGECVGPLLGGLLMEVLPQRREVGCKGKGEGGEEGGCVSGFRWTTAWIAMALAIAGCVCYVGLAKEGVGEEEGMDGDEVVAPTPVAAAVAAAATPAAVVEEGGAGMGGGRVHVYKPPTVVIPSPPLPPRRLSRPPTPISLASLRVPSTTSMAKPVSSSSAASSVGGSRRRSSGGGGDRQGEKEPGRKEKSGDREKE